MKRFAVFMLAATVVLLSGMGGMRLSSNKGLLPLPHDSRKGNRKSIPLFREPRATHKNVGLSQKKYRMEETDECRR